MTTSVDIVNQALQMMGAQTMITALGDGTPAGNAAAVLYAPTVQLVLRQLDPDFARLFAPLTLATGVTTPPPWQIAYNYPFECARLRQLVPQQGTYNINDPQPIRGNVSAAIQQPGNIPIRIIGTNLFNAGAIYTTFYVTEDEWDPIFEYTVVDQLARPLSMALAGRPDFAVELLRTAQQYAQLAELGDESMARSV